MVQQLTIVQQLRQSVVLVKPELLAAVPSDYNRHQTFNFLRHKATNYDELLTQHQNQYNNVTPAEVKALTQGAADVIIEALQDENDELIIGNANTIFAKFSRKLVNLLSLEPNIDLEGIYESTKTLKRSQSPVSFLERTVPETKRVSNSPVENNGDRNEA